MSAELPNETAEFCPVRVLVLVGCGLERSGAVDERLREVLPAPQVNVNAVRQTNGYKVRILVNVALFP